jgi:hypothetical protein
VFMNDLLHFKFQECRVLRREKEVALDELKRAQDIISRLKIEKNNKSIDMYDPNNPEVLHKRISKRFDSKFKYYLKKNIYLMNKFMQSTTRSRLKS